MTDTQLSEVSHAQIQTDRHDRVGAHGNEQSLHQRRNCSGSYHDLNHNIYRNHQHKGDQLVFCFFIHRF